MSSDIARDRTRRVQSMFARIVPRYDRLNTLMSFGMDERWRRRAAASASPRGKRVLDLGSGTGALTATLVAAGAAVVVGADLTPAMLRAARGPASSAVRWCAADAAHLPFVDDAFDAVTSAFLLRNLADLPGSLREMARVLRPGGTLVSLDMTQPPPTLIGRAFRLYFTRLLPPVAGMVSGDAAAYRYLPQSLEGFPDADSLARLMREGGLDDVTYERMAAGCVAMHVARKPA